MSTALNFLIIAGNWLLILTTSAEVKRNEREFLFQYIESWCGCGSGMKGNSDAFAAPTGMTRVHSTLLG